MYSLATAPILGFDLARLPEGDRLARLLLTALRLDEPTLALVASEHAGDSERAASWLDIGRAATSLQRAHDVLGQIPDLGTRRLGSDTDNPADVEDLVIDLRDSVLAARSRRAFLASLLELAPLGNLDHLLSCIRTEVFGWALADGDLAGTSAAARGAALVCDAAAAHYLSAQLPADAHDRLLAPWLRAQRHFAPGHDRTLIPGAPEVAELLVRVRGADRADRAALSRSGERWRDRSPGWAEAVQEAGSAVALTGRVRAAASAQLLLVLAVREADWPVAALAGGDWNVLSGAAHALAALDLLPVSVAERLLAPCEEVFGPVSTWAAEAAG